jgi:hypothetical protein
MKFSGERSHDHVVSLLATYEQFRKFNLIFYRAEGTLHDLWERKFPCTDYSTMLWVAEQFAGIADGLSRLHKLLSFTKPAVEYESIEYEEDEGKTNFSLSSVAVDKIKWHWTQKSRHFQAYADDWKISVSPHSPVRRNLSE